MNRPAALSKSEALAALRRLRAGVQDLTETQAGSRSPAPHQPGLPRSGSEVRQAGSQSPSQSRQPRSRSQARQATPAVVERCELCAQPLPSDHRHVVNLDSRALLCACRPCSLLFEQAELAYRTVPDRHVALPGLARQQWDSLDVPVGLAFVFHNSRQARTVICYPGPAGATEADLPAAALEVFSEAVPDVEAVLVRAGEGGFDRYIVPIDACYALVGHLRTMWRGFDGGGEVHARVAAFFADIERKAVRSK